MTALRQKTIHVIGAGLALLASSAALADTGSASFTPDQIKWTRGAAIPPGGLVALVYGNPGQAGPYITRVKLPADYKIAPHTHPDERVYTVISGTFYIGYGDTFEPARLKAFPAGSVFVVPASASHFHWMRSGEAVVQISGVGQSGTAYVSRADDPRNR